MRLPEQRLVVVEPVRVREQRQRAALAAVLRVVARRRRERIRVYVRLLQQRLEVDPAARRAVGADVVGVERADDVRSGAGADRRRDLVVVDAADDLDRYARVIPVVLGDDLLEHAELAGAPADPDGQRRLLRRAGARVRRAHRDCRCQDGAEHERRQQASRHASHSDPPGVGTCSKGSFRRATLDGREKPVKVPSDFVPTWLGFLPR